jgi:ABC-type multidrug transport system fused ATPase/permease subunit
VVLENELRLEDARQPLFAKKQTAGNSNTEMTKWKKKEKGKTAEIDKAVQSYERHIREIEKKNKELPPIQIRRSREGTGKSNDLVLEGISLVIAGKTLLESTTLKLSYGTKYGLVGRNGIGKTCLMNALARGEFPKTPSHLQILLVEQEVRCTDKSVLATVLETDIERENLFKEQEDLEKEEAKREGTNDARGSEITKRLN